MEFWNNDEIRGISRTRLDLSGSTPRHVQKVLRQGAKEARWAVIDPTVGSCSKTKRRRFGAPNVEFDLPATQFLLKKRSPDVKKNGRYEKRRKTCFEFFLVIAEGSKRWGFKEWKLYSLSSLPMMRNRRIEKGAFLSPKWRWSRIKTFVRRLLKESYDHKEIDLLSVLKIVLLCLTKSSLEL